MGGYKVIKDKCTGCEMCDDVCPTNALKIVRAYVNGYLNKVVAYIDEDTCIECSLCEPECPFEAIYSEEDLPEDYKHNPQIDPGKIITNPGAGGIDAIMEKFNHEKLKKIVDGAGLADGIQQLNHAAIKNMIKAAGAEPLTDVMEKALNNSPLKKIAFVGTVVNGYNVAVSLSDGEITNQDLIDAARFLFLDVGTYIPGPIGLILTGISVGITIAEY